MHLRCLYLSKNLISTVENLEALRALNTLGLSENRLTTLSGLAQLPNLASLNVSRNQLLSASDLRELEGCAELNNLDISHNQIDDNQDEGDESVLTVLTRVPQLKALRITGSPVVSRTKHFRKAFISAMPLLAFLDRPIFPIERAGVAAWKEGGNDAELRAKRAFVEKENDERKRTLHEFREWQAQVRECRLLEIEQEKARKQEEASPVEGDENALHGAQVTDCEVELHGFQGITKDEYLQLDATERAKWDERIRQAHADSVKDRYEALGDGVTRLGAKFWAENAPIEKPAEHSSGPELVAVPATTAQDPGTSKKVGRPDEGEEGAESRQSDHDSNGGGDANGETDREHPVPSPPPHDVATATSVASSTAHASESGETADVPHQCGTPEERAARCSTTVNTADPPRVPSSCSPEESIPSRDEATTGPSLLPPPAPISGSNRPEQRQQPATEPADAAAAAAVEPLPTVPARGRSNVFPGPKGTEPRETWAQLQRRVCEAPCPVRPPSLPSVFAVRCPGCCPSCLQLDLSLSQIRVKGANGGVNRVPVQDEHSDDHDGEDSTRGGATGFPERALTRAEILRELRGGGGGDKEAAAAPPPAPLSVAAASSAASPYTNVSDLD